MREYFIHIRSHLQKFETVPCVFEGCDFKTNIYATFHSHKSRKHNLHTLEDFKTTVLHQHQNKPDEESDFVEDENDCGSVFEEEDDLKKVITKRVGLLLLKMESIFSVSNTCIDELVEELHFLTASASGPVIKEIILNTLRNKWLYFRRPLPAKPCLCCFTSGWAFSSQFRRANLEWSISRQLNQLSTYLIVLRIKHFSMYRSFHYYLNLWTIDTFKNKRPSDVSSGYK